MELIDKSYRLKWSRGDVFSAVASGFPILYFIPWKLWSNLQSHVAADLGPLSLWIVSALFFAAFVWVDFIANGCKASDLIVLANSLLCGVLGSIAFALSQPTVTLALDAIGLKHVPLFLLVPTLLMILQLQITLKPRRADLTRVLDK